MGPGARLSVPKQLLDVLACPKCGSELAEVDSAMRCASGHAHPIRDGYLDVSSASEPDEVTARTADSFGYEWTTFDDVRDEDTVFAETYFRDLDLPTLRGSVGLDAGCGKGRYTRFLAPWLDGLIALDGSAAVEAATRNLRSFENVLVVRGDLREAPIRPGSLGFVSCLGVLHHLEDPHEGFRRLRRLLAPGGRMLIYVYSRPAAFGVRRVALAVAALLRRGTVRMPPRVLRTVALAVAALLYAAVVEPGRLGERLGVAALARLPMAAYRGKPFRSLELDTFDRLSAPVEHRYTWPELEPWFAEAGLQVVATRDEAGWFVLCRDPSSSSGLTPPGEPAPGTGGRRRDLASAPVADRMHPDDDQG